MFITRRGRCGCDDHVAIDGRRTRCQLTFLAAIQLDHVVHQLELAVNSSADSVMITFVVGLVRRTLTSSILIRFACRLLH